MIDIPTFIVNNWYLFLALIVVVAMIFAGSLNQYINNVKAVNSAEAIRLINHSKALVVDISEPKQFESGHVINAKNIPLSKFDSEVASLEKHKDKPIIVSCQTGHQSIKGAVLLRKKGFTSVYTLSGGTQNWQKDNLPLEK